MKSRLITGRDTFLSPGRSVPGIFGLFFDVILYSVITVDSGFQISRLQLFEMICELFVDTVVICH